MRSYQDIDIKSIIERCRALLYPEYLGDGGAAQYNVAKTLRSDLEEAIATSFEMAGRDGDAAAIAEAFMSGLPQLREMLLKDVKATYNGDPAAESTAEVVLCYPGIRAITSYRIAHALLLAGVPILPRIITEFAHSQTGIDIHPAASIGESFAIDHGTGVVIGATAILGKNVKLYQGVTLGAKSFPLDADGNPVKGIARHPILEDNVIVYSNATILGRVTIGHDATIGGNIWITEDVAPCARVVQSPKKYF